MTARAREWVAKAGRGWVAWSVVKASFFSGVGVGLAIGLVVMAGLSQAPSAVNLMKALAGRVM